MDDDAIRQARLESWHTFYNNSDKTTNYGLDDEKDRKAIFVMYLNAGASLDDAFKMATRKREKQIFVDFLKSQREIEEQLKLEDEKRKFEELQQICDKIILNFKAKTNFIEKMAPWRCESKSNLLELCHDCKMSTAETNQVLRYAGFAAIHPLLKQAEMRMEKFSDLLVGETGIELPALDIKDFQSAAMFTRFLSRPENANLAKTERQDICSLLENMGFVQDEIAPLVDAQTLEIQRFLDAVGDLQKPEKLVENIPTVFGNLRSGCLFIRACYIDVFNEIMTNGPTRPLCICGDPGIGKSIFMIYVFIRLIKLGKSVIMVTQGGSSYFYSHVTKSISFSQQSVHRAWLNAETWLLLDGRAHEQPYSDKKCCGVVFASPRRRNYHEFVKDRGIIFYLPPWSSVEIIQYIEQMSESDSGKIFIQQQLLNSPAFAACAKNPNDETLIIEAIKSELLKRYGIVGGRFRLLFHDVKTCGKLENDLYSAIQKLTVHQLINIRTISIYDFVPSLCYSITIKNDDEAKIDYSEYSIEFSSRSACRLAHTHLKKKWKLEQWKIFMAARDSGSGSSLAGQVFEHLVHDLFQSDKSHEFPIRKLAHNLPKYQKRKTTRASTKIDDDAVLKSKRQKVVSPAQSSARDERIMDESDSMDSDELDDEGGSLDIGNANVLDEENTEVSFVVKLTPVSSAEGTGDYAKALFTAKDNELIELKILNQEAIYFSSNKDWVDKPNGTYLIPSQSNWNRIDSLFQPDFAFQMTLSLSHPYNQAELTKQFPEREPLAFVYVVPLSKFNDFRFQKPSGINYRNFLLKNVHQYVMGIPDESIIEGEMAENKI